jgi:hypothetical protein
MSFTFSFATPQQHNEHGRPLYDTVRGIEASLSSLQAFTLLTEERHKAGYRRKERLNEFFVMGRYLMDTCGNTGKLSGWIPKEHLPDLPDVISRDAFWAYVKAHVPAGVYTPVTSNMTSDLPSDGVRCPICKKEWTLENCHDTVVVHTTETFPLSDFVGGTLAQVQAAYAGKTDAHYMMQNDILIRSDRFVDLSPKYPEADEDWKRGMVKNERGWVSSKEGIDGGYVIKSGDEGYFNVWRYYHQACNRLALASNEEKSFREIFSSAGFTIAVLHHLPNGYCPCERCAPWFRVETEVGAITLGWRKRVINIDWSEIDPTGKKIPSLFVAEDVTKGQASIHAWSRDKAIEYLSKIREAVAA